MEQWEAGEKIMKKTKFGVKTENAGDSPESSPIPSLVKRNEVKALLTTIISFETSVVNDLNKF